MRQEAVLLRAVETVDLVDEEQRAPALLASLARLVEDLPEIGDPGEDRRDLLEMKPGLAGEQPRNGGLAGARRAPQDDAAEASRREQPRQHAFRAGEVLLADDLAEALRA